MFEFIINGLVLVSLVAALYCLHGYVKERNLKFSWWKWILAGGWLLGMLVTFAFIGTAIGEGEPNAALRGGIALLILLAFSGLIIFALCFPGILFGFRKNNAKEIE